MAHTHFSRRVPTLVRIAAERIKNLTSFLWAHIVIKVMSYLNFKCSH